jgi:hypothetical protein
MEDRFEVHRIIKSLVMRTHAIKKTKYETKSLAVFKRTKICKEIEQNDPDWIIYINRKNSYVKNKYYDIIWNWASPNPTIGYLYLIKISDNCYKFGRTNNINRRLREYPKGSILLNYFMVDDMIKGEQILQSEGICSCNKRCYGEEYYEYDSDDDAEYVFNGIEKIL